MPRRSRFEDGAITTNATGACPELSPAQLAPLADWAFAVLQQQFPETYGALTGQSTEQTNANSPRPDTCTARRCKHRAYTGTV